MSDAVENLLPPEGKKIDTRLIFNILANSFGDSDLRQLCFELEWQYHNLAGERLSDRIRDLIEQFRRRQRLAVLVYAARRMRPHHNWDQIYVDITPEEENGDDLPGPKRQSTSGVGETTLLISKGVVALVSLMRKPEVGTAVVSFQTDFQAASNQIDRLNEYKLLHDLFQDLEYHYALINTQQVRLPADDMAWDAIITSEPEMQGKMSDLIDSATHALYADPGERWLRHMKDARDLIRASVEQEDDAQLRQGMRRVYHILSRQPTRLNAQLVTTANTLRLDTLEQALHEISRQVSGVDVGVAEELLEELDAGAEALEGLQERVNDLVREHKAWQYVDDELRRLEGVGLDELDLVWFDLQSAALEAIGDQEKDWAQSLRQIVADLDAAIAGSEAGRVRRFHRRFRTQANRRFRRVDAALLALCQDLQRVGESIDLLLRNYK